MFGKTVIRQGQRILQLSKENKQLKELNEYYLDFMKDVQPVIIDTNMKARMISTKLFNIQDLEHNGMSDEDKKMYRNKYINEAADMLTGIRKELDLFARPSSSNSKI